MRHSLCILFKTFIIVTTATMFVACDNFENIVLFKSVGDPDLFESDIDTDVDAKTIDIEVDMSEDLALTVMQASLFAYLDSPIYRYLDASEFPDSETSICLNIAEHSDEFPVYANFPSGELALEQYEVGDEIDIEYSNCTLSSGKQVSGSLHYRYTEVEGLNDMFQPISTEYCVSRLQEMKDGGTYDELFVSGDEVRFRAFGSETVVEVYEIDIEIDDETSIRTDTLKASHNISNSMPTLVVNERSNADDGDPVSVRDGDQIWVAHEGEEEIQNCQFYERKMRLTFTNFSIKDGDLTTTMRGAATVSNNSLDLIIESYDIVDSNFTVGLQENASYKELSLKGYNAELTESSAEGTYTVGFTGLVSSSDIGGTVELSGMDGNDRFGGNFGAYPTSGELDIIGRGVERVNLEANPQSLVIGVDYDGDDTRGGRSFLDESFLSSWEQLINRDFQREDFVVED